MINNIHFHIKSPNGLLARFGGLLIVFLMREHLIGSRPQAAAIPPGRGGTTKMIPCQTRAGYIYTAEEKAYSILLNDIYTEKETAS